MWKIYELQKILDVSELKEDAPLEYIGQCHKYNSQGKMNVDIENGVVGSFTRYNYPRYKSAFYEVKNIIESIIGEKLYPTYYFDRFYFSDTCLKKHIDRPACEISISLNISNNTGVDWPIFFEVGNERYSFTCGEGDGVLYKGMELPHWREKLVCSSQSYFHQAFFHYVRADGYFIQHAYDRI